MSEEQEIRKLVEQIQEASRQVQRQFMPELERIRERQRDRAIEHPAIER